MRKELTKLKEELIDGECLNKFATPAMFNNTHFKENEDKKIPSLLLEGMKQLLFHIILSFTWLQMPKRGFLSFI